jgi:hypothetical protein
MTDTKKNSIKCDCCEQPVDADQEPVLCDECAESCVGLLSWLEEVHACGSHSNHGDVKNGDIYRQRRT